MHPHIGLDHLTGYRFQIVKLSADTNTVVIRYEETAWPQETEPTRRMPWTEFVDILSKATSKSSERSHGQSGKLSFGQRTARAMRRCRCPWTGWIRDRLNGVSPPDGGGLASPPSRTAGLLPALDKAPNAGIVGGTFINRSGQRTISRRPFRQNNPPRRLALSDSLSFRATNRSNELVRFPDRCFHGFDQGRDIGLQAVEFAPQGSDGLGIEVVLEE